MCAQGGEREIVVGVDDELMKSDNRSIPRADVAELCIQSLLLPAASNRCTRSILHASKARLMPTPTTECLHDNGCALFLAFLPLGDL